LSQLISIPSCFRIPFTVKISVRVVVNRLFNFLSIHYPSNFIVSTLHGIIFTAVCFTAV